MNKLDQHSNHKTNRVSRRQQQGNTLVPVVIGLAIVAVATVAFLRQGTELSDNNNQMLAINEITAILGDVNMTKATGVLIAAINANNAPGLTANNVYGQVNAWNQPVFSYITDDATVCNALATNFTGYSGVSTAVAPACVAPAGAAQGAAATQLNITLQ